MLDPRGYSDLITRPLARAGDSCTCVVAMADGEMVEGIPVGDCTSGGCKVGRSVLFMSDTKWQNDRLGKYHHYPGIRKKVGFYASQEHE